MDDAAVEEEVLYQEDLDDAKAEGFWDGAFSVFLGRILAAAMAWALAWGMDRVERINKAAERAEFYADRAEQSTKWAREDYERQWDVTYYTVPPDEPRTKRSK